MKKRRDLTGKTFRKITVIRDLGDRKRWEIQCECGEIKSVTYSELNAGKHKSCGAPGCRNVDSDDVHLVKSVRRIYSKSNPFSLSDQRILQLVKSDCHYCDLPPVLKPGFVGSGKREIYAHGLDRVDSSKGYSPKNSVTCCEECNRLKLERSEKDFFIHIEKIYKFLKDN